MLVPEVDNGLKLGSLDLWVLQVVLPDQAPPRLKAVAAFDKADHLRCLVAVLGGRPEVPVDGLGVGGLQV